MREAKIKEFKVFLSNLRKTDKIAILYHRDPDGMCSALIASKAIERLRGKRPELLLHLGYGFLEKKPFFLTELKKKKINKVIVVDLSIDQNLVIVKQIEKLAEILIIDHHKIYNDLSGKKIVFIKAQFLEKIDGSRYPASKMCFDLFSTVTNVSDLDWIACIGIFGDFGFSNWKEFFTAAIERNMTNLSEIKKLKDLVEAVTIMREEKTPFLFEEFFLAKKISDMENSKYWKDFAILEKEISFWFDSVKEKAEFFPEIELVWLEMKSKNNIKSPLINRISAELYPNQTVIIVQDLGKSSLIFSARRQDFRVKMNELLETAVKGIKGASAGGHVPAAAGRVPKKQFKKFREKILELLKKH